MMDPGHAQRWCGWTWRARRPEPCAESAASACAPASTRRPPGASRRRASAAAGCAGPAPALAADDELRAPWKRGAAGAPPPPGRRVAGVRAGARQARRGVRRDRRGHAGHGRLARAADGRRADTVGAGRRRGLATRLARGRAGALLGDLAGRLGLPGAGEARPRPVGHDALRRRLLAEAARAARGDLAADGRARGAALHPGLCSPFRRCAPGRSRARWCTASG